MHDAVLLRKFEYLEALLFVQAERTPATDKRIRRVLNSIKTELTRRNLS